MDNNIFDVEQLDARLEMQIISAAAIQDPNLPPGEPLPDYPPCPQENGCQAPSCSWPF